MKAALVCGWLAVFSVPVTMMYLTMLALSYINEGYGLNPYLAGVVCVSLLAAGWKLAILLDQLEEGV